MEKVRCVQGGCRQERGGPRTARLSAGDNPPPRLIWV
jgi:hypothetical protein